MAQMGLEQDVPLLAKPFLPHDLVQRVRQTLDDAAPAAPARQG
jgi:hypothetical protein